MGGPRDDPDRVGSRGPRSTPRSRAAGSCGAQALDNIESFDRVMGRRRFALLDREVLNEARRIVKASANSAGQSRRLD